MMVSSSHQMNMFVLSAVVGILCSAVFDIQRIIRRHRKNSLIFTSAEDFIFAAVLTAAIICAAFIYNKGEIRCYMILGTAFGILIYMLFLSRIFTAVFMAVIRLIFAVFVKPIIFAAGILAKPLAAVFKTVKKLLKSVLKNIKIRLKILKKRVKML